MLNIDNNFLSHILPQQQYMSQQQIDINQLSQQMDIVWKIKTFLRVNVATKKYRFARTCAVEKNWSLWRKLWRFRLRRKVKVVLTFRRANCDRQNINQSDFRNIVNTEFYFSHVFSIWLPTMIRRHKNRHKKRLMISTTR